MKKVFQEKSNIGGKRVFINLTNHPSSSWGIEQTQDAKKYGDIVDIAFPDIPVDISDPDLKALVEEYLNRVKTYDDPVVMLQGEFVFVYRLVNRLKEAGIRVVSACTERIVSEDTKPDGSVVKTSHFQYRGLREY